MYKNPYYEAVTRFFLTLQWIVSFFQLQQQAQPTSARSTALSMKANPVAALDDETNDEQAFSNAAERVLSEAVAFDANDTSADSQLDSWRQKAEKVVCKFFTI